MVRSGYLLREQRFFKDAQRNSGHLDCFGEREKYSGRHYRFSCRRCVIKFNVPNDRAIRRRDDLFDFARTSPENCPVRPVFVESGPAGGHGRN